MHAASLPLRAVGASLPCLVPAPRADHAALIRGAFGDRRHGQSTSQPAITSTAIGLGANRG